MRICKKIAILTLIILISITLNVLADDSSLAKVTLTANKDSIKVDETVTIVLSATCDDGIEAINAVLQYDKEKLELVKNEMKNSFTDQSGTDGITGEYMLTALYGTTGAPTEAPTEAEFSELTFKVLENAVEGDKLEIELLKVQIVNPDLETKKGENQKVTLTVIEEKEPEEQQPQEPEPEKPKDEDKKPSDNTTADKNINYAGIEGYAVTLIVGVVIISIILYKKYKNYSDIY